MLVADMAQKRSALAHYDIRCPVHGFIQLNDWEMGIISEPAFQRLRRIRQLAWTDYVYPGAMHTRFEHSLGVMHTATLLYDSIVRNSREVLESDLAYDDAGFSRYKQLVRLAALLHDVGHGPFHTPGKTCCLSTLTRRSNINTRTTLLQLSALNFGLRSKTTRCATTTVSRRKMSLL